MIHETLIPFLWLIIPLIGLLVFFRIRTNYKIEQMKVQGKQEKKEQTFEGSINKMLNDAPKQLKQIDSEIATLQEKGRREHLTEEQMKSMLGRLNSERDMLSYAVKYGDLAKPFVKPLGITIGLICS